MFTFTASETLNPEEYISSMIAISLNSIAFFGLKFKSGKLKKMSSLLDAAIFPGNQGGPLEHVIAAKAVAFDEALSDDFLNYIVQVRKNANVMSKEFINRVEI